MERPARRGAEGKEPDTDRQERRGEEKEEEVRYKIPESYHLPSEMRQRKQRIWMGIGANVRVTRRGGGTEIFFPPSSALLLSFSLFLHSNLMVSG